MSGGCVVCSGKLDSNLDHWIIHVTVHSTDNLLGREVAWHCLGLSYCDSKGGDSDRSVS